LLIGRGSFFFIAVPDVTDPDPDPHFNLSVRQRFLINKLPISPEFLIICHTWGETRAFGNDDKLVGTMSLSITSNMSRDFYFM
jgi:hypothetical protein